MTIPQLVPPTSVSTALAPQAAEGGGPRQVGQVGQVGQSVPTAGSPVQQTGDKPSWFAKNIKLIGILGGAAVGGAIGFLTLGPVGGLGGAAVGALAGYLLTRNRTSGGGDSSGQQLPPPLPS
ncbi:MAG: hypothetical protein JWL76_479 [Thermoleophilia bacterium]|nr:hypothetical protein [Thermoleophilia bacterium]